ncbi:hypothetical protein HaLaN_22574, partial [Haematococcus lacustris]
IHPTDVRRTSQEGVDTSDESHHWTRHVGGAKEWRTPACISSGACCENLISEQAATIVVLDGAILTNLSGWTRWVRGEMVRPWARSASPCAKNSASSRDTQA